MLVICAECCLALSRWNNQSEKDVAFEVCADKLNGLVNL